MSKVYEHYQEESGKSYRRSCERMPKGRKGGKKKAETQVEGQMEFALDQDNELKVVDSKPIKVVPESERTRDTQRAWNREAQKYYAMLEEMISSYGAYLMILRPWQDIKKNGKDASDGTMGVFNEYYKCDFDKMTRTVYQRKDELIKSIYDFSKEAARFNIEYPVRIEEALGERVVRERYRGYIKTKVAELKREAEALNDPYLEFIPEKAITKVLSPADMRVKYGKHKRKNK